MAHGHAPGSQVKVLLRLLAVTSCVLIALSGTARAQVPELPPLPEEAEQALEDLAILLIPQLNEGAAAAAPGANGVGFALRPACASVGIALFAGSLTGVVIPYPRSMSLYLAPLSTVCLAATDPGPADPVLAEGDAGAKPVVDQANAVVDQGAGTVIPQVAPARPNIAEVCTNYALTEPILDQLPPPLHRLQPIGIVCSKV